MKHANDGSPYPKLAWVGLTSHCNLQCEHCQRLQLHSQGVLHPQHMPVQVFDKIEQQLLPHLTRIQLGGNNFGEPLLAPKWDDVFDRVSRSGVAVSLVSNGVLMNSRRTTKMVEAGVEFNFSLEGAHPETYERIRGRSLEEFRAIVGETCRIRDEHNASGAKVNLGFTVRRDNIEEVVDLIDLAADLGVDRVTITHFVPWTESQRNLSLVYHKEVANDRFVAAAQAAHDAGLLLDLPKPFPVDGICSAAPAESGGLRRDLAPCYHPWQSISINEQGDVMPCCATSVVLGNLKRTDFDEIWNGWRYRRLRRTVNSARPLRFCQDCGLRGIEIGADHALSFCSDEKILLGAVGGNVNGNLPSNLRRLRQIIAGRRWVRGLVPKLTGLYRRHAAFLHH